jgi:hypothetical protein
MMDTGRRHESPRVVSPAGNSVLSLFTAVYASSWNCQNLATEQPIRGQAVQIFPSQYKSRRPPSPSPDMPARTPVRSSTLAISLCGGMIQLLGLAGLADSRLNLATVSFSIHKAKIFPRYRSFPLKKTAYRIQKLILKIFSYVSSNLRAYVRY